MKSEDMDNIVFLTIIAGRKQKDALLSALHEKGVPLSGTMYGKGTVCASYLKNVLGLVPEENKAVITCLMTKEMSETVLRLLIDDFKFDRPNTGMAFTVPVTRLSF